MTSKKCFLIPVAIKRNFKEFSLIVVSICKNLRSDLTFLNFDNSDLIQNWITTESPFLNVLKAIKLKLI